MALTTITRNDLAALDYGRGAERIITGARYAVVTGPTAHINSVLSTHRTYEAAERVLRRAFRNGTGVIHIAEIVS